MAPTAIEFLPAHLTREAGRHFRELRRVMHAQGMMEKAAVRTIVKLVCLLTALAAGVVFVTRTDSFVLRLTAAAYLSIVQVQVGLIGHELGHLQVFSSVRLNCLLAYVCNFVMGFSAAWWIDQHNQHHAHPNRQGVDPDIDIPILAFSEEQAATKRGISRWIVRRQRYLVFPVLCLSFVCLRVSSVRHMIDRGLRHSWIDALLMTIHFTLVLSAPFWLFPNWWQAGMVLLFQQCLLGMYMGSIFAPNHKGMIIFHKDANIEHFTEQVLTSRNVRAHPLTDFWYGGLNYQIEHHLFPQMPNCNLRKANSLVKQYCLKEGIPFHETSIWQSYVELSKHVGEVADRMT
jgi:fatty acid desaturase